MKRLVLVSSFIFLPSLAIHKEPLSTFATKVKNPFSYNLGIKTIVSSVKNAEVIVCCHGYGHSNALVDVIHSHGITNHHLVGFNFPDYNLNPKTFDHSKSSFGTIHELLPLLYVLHNLTTLAGSDKIHLYGFSAGGGAVINSLATLLTTKYDHELESLGITSQDKQNILSALRKGVIFLDCPLKSMEEIISLRGPDKQRELVCKQYVENNMRPIDTVLKLAQLNCKIVLNFENPDEVIGNQDDALFIKRLKAANRETTVIVSHDGYHSAFHLQAWKEFLKNIRTTKK